MNPDTILRLAALHHQHLLHEAETARQVCCLPKKIKVALPNVAPPVPTTCLTC